MGYTPLQLADAFIRTGELKDALDALAQHLSANPGDDEARRLRIEVLMRQPTADALAEFDLLGALSADDYVRKSIVLAAAGRQSEAVTAMREAHNQRPQDERIAERYFELLLADRQLDPARDLLNTMPNSWRWMEHEGDLEMAAENYPMAMRIYAAACSSLSQQLDPETNEFARSLYAVLDAKYNRAMSAF